MFRTTASSSFSPKYPVPPGKEACPANTVSLSSLTSFSSSKTEVSFALLTRRYSTETSSVMNPSWPRKCSWMSLPLEILF